MSRGDRVGESLVSAVGVAEEEKVPLPVPAGPVGVLVKVPPLLLGVSLGMGGVERVVDGEREKRGEVEGVAEKEGDLEVRVDGVKLGEMDAIAGSVADPENEEDGVASPDCVEEKEENRLGVSAEGEACRLVSAVGLKGGAMVGVGVGRAVPVGLLWEGVRVKMEALGTPDTEGEAL